ncbi:MAG: hypothetical protein J6P44_03260 [Bacteroidales bacterium]|nr:hypothetical protein [Bacteroidales bacterium]
MKEFFDLLGWKNIIVAFLALVLIRISIIIPFYAQWYLPVSITWEYFLMFTFGLCFILSGNNIAIKFYDEKLKVCRQDKTNNFNIKQYPDIVRLRGLWVVMWFTGLVAVVWASVVTKNYFYYPVCAIVTALIGYAYANSLRYKFLSGNLALGLINALVIFSQLPHDKSALIPVSFRFPVANAILYQDLVTLFVFLALMVFILTIIRDITGDVTNIAQDTKNNYSTLAVKSGESKSKTVLYALSLLFIAVTCVFMYIYSDKLGAIQIVITSAIVILPVIYYMVTLQKAKVQTDYNYLYVFLGMVFISLLFVISFCKYLFINGNLQ